MIHYPCLPFFHDGVSGEVYARLRSCSYPLSRPCARCDLAAHPMTHPSLPTLEGRVVWNCSNPSTTRTCSSSPRLCHCWSFSSTPYFTACRSGCRVSLTSNWWLSVVVLVSHPCVERCRCITAWSTTTQIYLLLQHPCSKPRPSVVLRPPCSLFIPILV
jgi:hypothetical protein